MENFEQKKIPPEDTTGKPEDTIEEKDKYKSSFTEFYEKDAEELRKKIRELMEENKKIKKKLEDLST